MSVCILDYSAGTFLPIHSSHFILLNPIVTKYLLHERVSREAK
jgi:hypothetical protein